MIGSFLTVGQQVLFLFALMAVGFILGKTHLMDDRGSLAMTNLVMYAVSPAMMVVAFQRDKNAQDLHNFATCLLLAVLVHGAAILLAILFLRGKDVPCRVLRFGVVFPNCAFMGYPLMMALLGSIGIFYGSAYVMVFTVLSWSLGIYMLTGDAGKLRPKALVLNAGILSVVVAMALYLCSVRLPTLVMTPLRYLADMNTPLPNVVVGYQLSHVNFRQAFKDKRSWLALVLRLAVIPLVTIALCYALRASGEVALVTVIAASTPPAALLGMFAQKFESDTKLASSVVSVFTAISVLTIPLVVGLAQHLLG